jgi:UDP-galactopyranose mutase
MPGSRDHLIIGGGLTGLAAASRLGDRATILERADRPGGLVRSVRLGQHWFDLVIHLLYFRDLETETSVRSLLGDVLLECPPAAWVETDGGVCRFPIQMHLRGLRPEYRIRCLEEMARAASDATIVEGASIERLFKEAFGDTLCELFMLPYNRKMWRRPLESIDATGLSWNVERPEFREVLRGAIDDLHRGDAYNSRGFYPRPAAGSEVRGMEVLSRALATHCTDLRIRCTVTGIDADSRTVHYLDRSAGPSESRSLQFQGRLLSTIPLPLTAMLCRQTPERLRDRLGSLRRNRVVSVFVAVEGERPPDDFGHWRYYADETLCFTRLVFMHAFDPEMAPASGWGLLVEIPERAEEPLASSAEYCGRAVADARRVGVLRSGDRVVECGHEVVDPAYVVLGPGDKALVEDAIGVLADLGIDCRGRYGAWKYCGMSHCLREGFEWGDSMAAAGRDGGT